MQELVVESLVVSLAMVVFYVLVDETTQMPLAERDHACETLLFDRPDEPLGIGVEIGTLRRQPNRLNTGALQDLAKDPRIEGIAVVNQMARPAQTAIDRVGQIAGLLLHPRAARLRVDPGDGHAAGSQLDHEEDEVPPEPRQRQHLDGEQIAGRQALPVRLQERLPGHVPAPLGCRGDSVVVQDPLHRGPGDSVADEVRERAADPRVAPPRIVDRHPDHELGDVLSGHWSTSTSAGAAIVFLGDQSPVPTQDRIRGDDARDLRQDPPAEFVTAHSESMTLGVRQAKRPRAQVFSEDPILLPEIVDQIVLVTVHPASEREDEELQRRWHSLRLLGRLDQHRPSLGRFFAPYGRHLPEILAAGEAVFTELKNLVVWVKDNGGMGTFYRSRHELILVFKHGTAPHCNTFELGQHGRYRTNVWEYRGVNTRRAGRMADLALHPTVKPVQLIADALRDVSGRGEIVLDGFGGSGSTLIAAEKTGRRARLCEIDPIYCDRILARWEAYAQDDAARLETEGAAAADGQAVAP